MSVNSIVEIAIAPFGMINCFAVMGDAGVVLVDTGLPGSAHKIRRALRAHGLDWGDIKLIVVTHAHLDHAGNAAWLREKSGAPIVGHVGDLAHYQQKKAMTFCATGWVGHALFHAGLIRRPYQAFTPDILMTDDDEYDLSPFGVDGAVIPTTGHTCGSLSVRLADGRALVGDLIASGILLGGIARKGRAKRPPFEDQPAKVSSHLDRMLLDGTTKFYMGHGGPLPAAEVRRHAAYLRKLSDE